MREKEEYSDLELCARAGLNGLGAGTGLMVAAAGVIPLALSPYLASESYWAGMGSLISGLTIIAGGINMADHCGRRLDRYRFELRKQRASRRDEVYE